jgi:hypothetical protein
MSASGISGRRPSPKAAARLDRRRFASLAAILGLALLLASRFQDSPQPPPKPPEGHIVYIDVEGWYRRTPDEVAARTPFRLTLDGLPAGLPLDLGPWQGTDREHDPAVDEWLREPEVSVERTYRRADGALVWLSAFGSRGNKSYHLFEHTPETCYPLGGWQIRRYELLRLPRGPRPMPVNSGMAEGGQGRLVFVYFYIWDSPARDPERGVVSLRLASPVREDAAETLAMLTEEFVPQLFPATLGWRRF